MNKNLKIIAATLMSVSVFVTPQLFANSKSDETASVSNALKEQLAQLNNLQANYQQQVFDNAGNKVMAGEGLVKLKRPEKLFWQQTSPDQTLLISNGEKTYYFDEFAEQVTILNSKKLINSTPFALLTSNDSELWQSYYVLFEDGKYLITPINKGESQVERLQLSFAENLLTTMEVFDNTGQTSVYKFSEQKVNQAVNDTVFKFEIPAGVFVDDQTQGE